MMIPSVANEGYLMPGAMPGMGMGGLGFSDGLVASQAPMVEVPTAMPMINPSIVASTPVVPSVDPMVMTMTNPMVSVPVDPLVPVAPAVEPPPMPMPMPMAEEPIYDADYLRGRPVYDEESLYDPRKMRSDYDIIENYYKRRQLAGGLANYSRLPITGSGLAQTGVPVGASGLPPVA